MKGIEVAREVVRTRSAHVFRPRKDQPGEYDAKPWATGGHRRWVLLDLFSASVLTQVYDNLKPEAREKLEGFIAKSLSRAVVLCYQVVNKAQEKAS